MKVHLFNPENDLALAADIGHYTPPKAARIIRDAGALLPLWWADKEDIVLAPDSKIEEAIELKRCYGLDGEIAERVNNELPWNPQPWGWSYDARQQLLRAGVAAEYLPDDIQLALHRDLSHRRTSIKVLKELGEKPELLPIEVRNERDGFEAISKWDGDAYIKFPWSGSGRGVFPTKGMSYDRMYFTMLSGLGRQGSIIIEKARDKVKDFAMLFEATDSGVEFRGLSSFITSGSGAYGGNLVASQRDIVKEIGLDPRTNAPLYERVLGKVVGRNYRGWLGVDMMVERREDGRREIVPCVEVNLRMTMGVAALLIRERLPESTPPKLLSLKSGSHLMDI